MPLRSPREKPARCACCSRVEILKRHHCHLQDVISSAIKEGLGLGGDPLREQRVFACRAGWPFDKRVIQALRFRETYICELCNTIDVLSLATRPGFFFSLSPVEIREIRAAAGHADNEGAEFATALQTVRSREASDYLARERHATELGRQLAGEWLADPRFPEWVSDEAAVLQRAWNSRARSARALALASVGADPSGGPDDPRAAG